MKSTNENSPLIDASELTSSSTLSPKNPNENSNFYFVKRQNCALDDNKVAKNIDAATRYNSITVADVISPLGEDGEPSTEEVVYTLPKNSVSGEFLSRPIMRPPKNETTEKPPSNPFQYISTLFKTKNTTENSSFTNTSNMRNNLQIRNNKNGQNRNDVRQLMKSRQTHIQVEPKVFFANERTFLAWIHISVLLAGTSIGIIALTQNKSMYSAIYGILILPVAITFLIYAMIQYIRRSAMIRRRDPGPYEEIVGPIILTFMLMSVIVMQFAIKLYSITD